MIGRFIAWALVAGILFSTPKEFADAVKTDIEKWTRVVKAAGIKPDS